MKSNHYNWLSCIVISACMFGCGSDGKTPADSVAYDAVCGNAEIETGETCDDGNAVGNDGCSSTCAIENGWECPTPGASCQKINPNADPNVDPPASESACGDGKLGMNEACDDGNRISGDGCSEDCAVEKGYDCSSGMCELIQASEDCGNGIVEDDEECDDGNRVSGDGCAANCLVVESGYACPQKGGACIKQEASVCGDGSATNDEECDDGNRISGDGCSADCAIEDGWMCENGENCKPICGDGHHCRRRRMRRREHVGHRRLFVGMQNRRKLSLRL